MSNLQLLTKKVYKIESYLRSKGLPSNTSYVSNITAEFLKSKNLPYMKYNPRYKGLFTANIQNASSIIDNFDEFKTFVEQYIEQQ